MKFKVGNSRVFIVKIHVNNFIFDDWCKKTISVKYPWFLFIFKFSFHPEFLIWAFDFLFWKQHVVKSEIQEILVTIVSDKICWWQVWEASHNGFLFVANIFYRLIQVACIATILQQCHQHEVFVTNMVRCHRSTHHYQRFQK